MTPPDAIDCDVAVFGSGAAGMAAALTAACEGLSVALFDKAAALGGTTATSGGVAWIPGNSAAAAMGWTNRAEDLENARRLLRDQCGANWRPDLVEAYLRSGAEAIDYLAAHADLRFEPIPAPDYVSSAPGAALKGRALSPLPFDGRLLGRHFNLVRAPRPAFMVLGGLMVGRKEIPQFLRPFSSWQAFSHVTRVVSRHAVDRVRFARGTRLLMGNALIGRAVQAALKRGVRIHTGAALTALHREGGPAGGRVAGATVRMNGADVQVRASRAVVLATGGFAHSRRLRDAHAPAHPHSLSLAAPENMGDAVEAALRVGASVDTRVESPGFWTPATRAVDGAGNETLYPYGHLDRGKPGAIIVDRTGRRFVNEADSYHHVVLAMFQRHAHAPQGAAFIVCDSDFLRQYGLGLAKPAPFPTGPLVRSGYLKRADTLSGLASALGVNAAGLEAEVARHNRFAATGRDEDFHKGESAFNRWNGDSRVQPNPCLAPLARPPFYATEIFPCTIGMAAGLLTDEHARVLDATNTPIDGLYACGNDMASVTRGAYPGPGITIGPGLVFGYRAMKHAASQSSPTPKELP